MSQLDVKGVLAKNPWYERALAVVAPETALRRAQAKLSRHIWEYQAAQTDRLFSPKTFGYPSENSAGQRDRVVMMWEARDLVDNYENAKTVLGKFSNSIVPCEWSPQTGDANTNALYDEYFHSWCKQCDITGRYSFKKLLQLAAEMRPVDGDCGFVQRTMGGMIKLQLVAADLIGNPNRSMAVTDNYFGGITVDDVGAPISYEIWHVTPQGAYDKSENIPAAFFRHYHDPYRADQYRGVSAFHATSRTIRMQKETLAAENVAQCNKSKHVALVFNERGQANPRQAFQTTPQVTLPSGGTQYEEHKQVGTIAYFKSGDRVETMPARPGDGFLDYNDHSDKMIARGLDIPYAVLFGTTNYKGSNIRAEFAQADRIFDRHRGVLADQVADPIKNAVILHGIAQGDLPLPPRKAKESIDARVCRALKGEWRYPAQLTIDIGNSSTANLNEHRQGIKSGQMIAAEGGYDYFSALEQKAQEEKFKQDLAIKYEIPETAIGLPVPQLPSTPSAAATIGSEAGEDAAEAQVAATNAADDAAARETTKRKQQDYSAERQRRDLLRKVNDALEGN